MTPTSLSCTPTSLGPSASSTCTVTLNQAAPTGGSSVTLSKQCRPHRARFGGCRRWRHIGQLFRHHRHPQHQSERHRHGHLQQRFADCHDQPGGSDDAYCAGLHTHQPGVQCSSTCTVTLNPAAPTGGMSSVTLSSNNAR